MNQESSNSPSSYSPKRRRRGGRNNRRDGGRNEGQYNRGGDGPRRGGRGRRRPGPYKKDNPIVAFFKKLFGIGKPAKRPERPERENQGSRNGVERSEPRFERRSRDNRPAAGRPMREEREQVASSAPAQEQQVDSGPLEVLSEKLYVGNLSYDTLESDIYDHFAKVGLVKNVEIVRAGDGRSKGFGFVEMNAVESAQQAAEQFNRTEFMGREILVAGAKK